MNRKQIIKEFESELGKLLKKYNCELIDFEYYHRIFGNMVLTIRFRDITLDFVTDRGEIYCNGEFLCDYEYLRRENKTTPQKLLEQIELKLKTIQ